jgi:hypothetical protein
MVPMIINLIEKPSSVDEETQKGKKSRHHQLSYYLVAMMRC